MNRTGRYLNYNERLEIVKRIDSGESCRVIATDYGLARRTVEKIKKNKDSIKAYINKFNEEGGVSRKRHLTRNVKNEALEKAMYAWFLQKQHHGEHVSASVISKQALLLNRKLNGPKDFTASKGWFDKFKKRHGFCYVSEHGDKLPTDLEAAEHFREEFQKRLRLDGYELENVYNADESGIQWKILPKSTFIKNLASTAKDKEILRDRAVIMVCTNATGTHKIPLLIIGKIQKSLYSKDTSSLGVKYITQKRGSMDSLVFTQWFTETFIQSVEKRQIETQKFGKVILLLDNAPPHLPLESTCYDNEKYKIVFIPKNVTVIQQPMDQGIIEKLKIMYRMNLLRMLALEDQEEDIARRIKNLTMKDCCLLLSGAWDSLTTINIRTAWQKLIDFHEVLPKTENNEENRCPRDFDVLDLLQQIPTFSNCNDEDIQDWLQIDRKDPGWEILDDECMASSVDEDDPNIEIKENFDECSSDEESDTWSMMTDSETRATEPNEDHALADNISSKDAFTAVNALIGYVKKNASFNETDLARLSKVQAIIKEKILDEKQIVSVKQECSTTVHVKTEPV